MHWASRRRRQPSTTRNSSARMTGSPYTPPDRLNVESVRNRTPRVGSGKEGWELQRPVARFQPTMVASSSRQARPSQRGGIGATYDGTDADRPRADSGAKCGEPGEVTGSSGGG